MFKQRLRGIFGPYPEGKLVGLLEPLPSKGHKIQIHIREIPDQAKPEYLAWPAHIMML